MDDKRIIKTRKVKAEVKGKIIEFDELYMLDSNTNEEIFNRNLEIENDIRLYDIYKEQEGLLTSTQIKNIRKKYNMSQKEFALAIGVGEVTIHRFENGSIQTASVDSIIRLSANPDIMADLLNKNKANFQDDDEFNKLMSQIKKLKKLKQHRIAKFDIKSFSDLTFKTARVENVTNQLIIEYNTQVDNVSKKYKISDNCGTAEYITPLKLQKLLYYIQGLALRIYDKPAFYDNIEKWSYGPVVEKIYHKYKKGRAPILTPEHSLEVSPGTKKIIQLVVSSYGKLEAGSLVDLTHDETPWLEASNDQNISEKKIKEYFNEVYSD